MTMNTPLIITLTNNTPLPLEIWLKIFYDHKGFITPSALIMKKISPIALLIKKHMKKNKLTEYIQIDYYFEQYNSYKFHVSETTFEISDDFITRDLINTDDPEDENKFSFLWNTEVYDLVDKMDEL